MRCGGTSPFATSHSTRSAIVWVLPDPAPATIEGFERGLDRGHLLVGRLVVARGPQLVGGQIGLGARVLLGDLVERQQQLAHDACSPSAGSDGPVTSRPSSCSGQLLRTGQWLQCLFSAATKAEPAIRSAAATSISSAHAG